MKIVLVGAKDRSGDEETKLVHDLMDMAAQKYPDCIFVTLLTDKGIGTIVKKRCLEKDASGRFRFRLVVHSLQVYAKDLSRTETEAIYEARNATLFELGDVFIVLVSQQRYGKMETLIKARIIPSGRPYVVLSPTDPPRVP